MREVKSCYRVFSFSWLILLKSMLLVLVLGWIGSLVKLPCLYLVKFLAWHYLSFADGLFHASIIGYNIFSWFKLNISLQIYLYYLFTNWIHVFFTALLCVFKTHVHPFSFSHSLHLGYTFYIFLAASMFLIIAIVNEIYSCSRYLKHMFNQLYYTNVMYSLAYERNVCMSEICW